MAEAATVAVAGGNSGEDNGGAVEEMDQDGSDVGGPSGRVYPADWTTKTKDQKKKYIYKRRRQYGPFAFCAIVVLLPSKWIG
jgi:hypothetical protein